MNVQSATYTFLTPPDISLPTTKPPCPCNTVLSFTITFSQGSPRRRPSASLPDFIQMASSPASNRQLATTTFLHDSTSRASPFCEYQGLNTLTPSNVRSSQESGCRHQLGELRNVTPSSNMRLLFTKLSSTGRNQRFIPSHSSAETVLFSLLPVSTEAFKAPASGYHTLPASSTTPPDLSSAFHCPSVILLRFTGRQLSPEPSKTPCPVMAIFSAFIAEIGDWQRSMSNPSKEVCTNGYKAASSLKSTSAFRSACKLTLLCNTIGPVSHNPSGMITLPPPFSLTALMALFMASVFSVSPSAFAPKSRIST